MYDEGYIKFNCRWVRAGGSGGEAIAGLKVWRDRLYGLGLIGVYADGIGFGNISERLDAAGRFIITGTRTGGVPALEPAHVATVTDVDIAGNTLGCTGPVEASSEAMTHAALYGCNTSIGGVIHVHHLPTWSALLGAVPTTGAGVPYGTPEMAWEIERLYGASDMPERKIVVMAGHREGIITFGRDLDEAGEILLRYIVREQ